MKKFLAVAASAVLAVSMLGFTACSDSNDGVIKGNYTTPTQEEFSSAISSIDTDKAFGDETKGPSFEILSKFSTSLTMGSESVSADLDLGYKLALGESGLLGSGTMELKANSKTGGREVKENYNATVYNDTNWAYAELAGIQSSPLKCKIDLNNLPSFTPNALEADTELTEFFSMCDTYKIKLGLDASDGVKIKASLSEESVWAMIAESEITEEEIAQVKEIVKFNTFKFDLYVAFDKEGLFSQASIDMNIEIKINCDALDGIIGQVPGYTPGTLSGDMALKLKGYFTAKVYTGTVTLPEGIGDDAAYIDITGMIGGIIG